MTTKHCPSCDIDKDVSAFYLSPRRPDGLSSYCKPCAIKHAKNAPSRLRPARGVTKHVTEKFCPVCQDTKPAEAFYTNLKRNDGLSSYCRICLNDKMKKAYVPKAPKDVLPLGIKRCSKCKEAKPKAEFGLHKSAADGLQYYCKKCAVLAVTASRKKDPSSHRQASLVWERANLTVEQKADNNLFHKLGLKPGSYAQMYDAQEGRCAICETTNPGKGSRRFHVDHCHDTDKVRALLCSCCNTGIGQLKHDVKLLLRAIEYLNTHHPPSE